MRVEDPRVSGEHASLHWLGGRWELRDLGSRNGTFVDGRRLATGERVALTRGARFALGGSEPERELVLLDAGPPSAVARHAHRGEVRAASEGLLVLPDDEHPLASVFEDASGRWVVEIGDAVRQARDQEVLVVGGEPWILELPTIAVETWQGQIAKPYLEAMHLRLGVSRDEEHVEVTLLHGAQALRLPARTFHYLLVLLARAWLADAGAPEPERGWVEREELARMLGVDLSRVNVDIHRARKQLAEMGVIGAANVVVRRPDCGQLRLGVRSMEVYTL